MTKHYQAIDKRAMELSDVISVHAYCDLLCLQSTLQEVTQYGKPILLTEWMARQVQSTYETALPTLKELKVGAYQWGLVKGKTQTHLPWPHVAHQFNGDAMWWHDVLDADGTFHNEQEGEVIRSFVYPQNKALTSDVFLLDVDSTESIDKLVTMANLMDEHHTTAHPSHAHLSQNEVLVGGGDPMHNSNSLNHLMSHHSHHHMMAEGISSMTLDQQLPTLQEGEQQVIPSVCSISMATINAAAAQQAGEMSIASDLMDYQHAVAAAELQGVVHGAKSTPTFGSHMTTSSIVDGLDLAEISGGIEF